MATNADDPTANSSTAIPQSAVPNSTVVPPPTTTTMSSGTDVPQNKQSDDSVVDRNAKLSDNKIKLRTKSNKIVEVDDTIANREKQEGQSKRAHAGLKVNKGFETLGTQGEDETLPDAPFVDDSKQELVKLAVGIGFVDVTHLQNRWDPKAEDTMNQRSINPIHVGDIRASLETSGFDKVSFENRLRIVMDDDDLTASCTYTDTVLKLPLGTTRQLIGDKTQLRTTTDDFPRLLLAPSTNNAGRVFAYVEAGQHRILAMEAYEARHLRLPDGMTLDGDDLVSEDAERKRLTEQYRGWSVMIYNTDLNKTAEGHRALAIVRRNEEVVKAKDSLGTTVYSILTRWTKVFSQEQKDEYAKNFTEMCRDHHRMKATDSAKLKRVFLTPRMAEVLEPFLRCRWARDLYIEDRITALIDVRMIRFVGKLLTRVIANLHKLIEPGLILKEDANAWRNANEQISLVEVEAIAECFSGEKLNTSKWTKLFYPGPEDTLKFKAFPTPDYALDVKNDRYKMPEETNAERDGREYRRPLFLKFLDPTEYHAVYRNAITDAKHLRLVRDPLRTGDDSILLPTKQWFKDFCLVDVAKLYHISRFHFFAAVPSKYAIHAALASGGQGSKTGNLLKNLDIESEFRKAFVKIMEDAAKERVRKARGEEIADDSDEEGDSSGKVRLTAAERSVREMIEERNAATEATGTAEIAFVQYLETLWRIVCGSSATVAKWTEACFIGPEYFIQSHTSEVILKLYRQVLEAKLLRATFEEAFVPYLGVAMLRGLTAAFGAQNLGSVDQGVSFWDLKVKDPMSVNAGVTAAARAVPGLTNRPEKDRTRLAEVLEGPTMLFHASFILENSTELVLEHRKRIVELKLDADVDVTDPVRFEGAKSGEIQNYEDLDYHEKMVSNSIRVLGAIFQIEEFKFDNPDEWWDDNDRRDTALSTLPHTSGANLFPALFVMDENRVVLPRPLERQSDEHEEEIEMSAELVRIAMGDTSADIRQEAKAYFEKAQITLAAGRKKAADKKRRREELNEAGEGGSEPSSKRRKGSQDDTEGSKKPEKGGSSGTDDMDEEPEWSNFEWDLEGNALPSATEDALFRYLKLADLNQTLWTAAAALPTKALKARHTANAKKDRLELLKDWAEDQVAVQWVPSGLQDIGKLLYDSELTWKKAQKTKERGAGPAKANTKGGKGQGSGGRTRISSRTGSSSTGSGQL